LAPSGKKQRMNGVGCGSGRVISTAIMDLAWWQGCAERNGCSNVACLNSRHVAESAPILGREVNLHALSVIVVIECAAHLLLILEVLA